MTLGYPTKTAVFLLFLFAIGTAVDAGQGRKQVLDQSNDEMLGDLLNGGSVDYEWQQGITAGITGQLTRVALFVDYLDSAGEPAATEVSVRLGPPWQSGAPAWTTTAVLDEGWNTFNVTSAKIFLVAGDEYTVGIHGQSAHNFNPGFGFSHGDQYPAGELLMNGSTVGSEGNDLLFRMFVKP